METGTYNIDECRDSVLQAIENKLLKTYKQDGYTVRRRDEYLGSRWRQGGAKIFESRYCLDAYKNKKPGLQFCILEKKHVQVGKPDKFGWSFKVAPFSRGALRLYHLRFLFPFIGAVLGIMFVFVLSIFTTQKILWTGSVVWVFIWLFTTGGILNFIATKWEPWWLFWVFASSKSHDFSEQRLNDLQHQGKITLERTVKDRPEYNYIYFADKLNWWRFG